MPPVVGSKAGFLDLTKGDHQYDGKRHFHKCLEMEGAALPFDTLVDGAAERDRYTLMDHWKLVKEGQRLMIHREIVRRRGEAEADLVYDKQ